ncbi:MAG: tyrosine-type recombinase/integrase [Alphaproteobacteria bacterium]
MGKLKYLNKAQRGLYYRRILRLKDGSRRAVYEPIPFDFGTPEFFTEYARINEKYAKGQNIKPEFIAPKKSLFSLMDDFLGSAEFGDMGVRSRKEYEDGLADIKATWPDRSVKTIERYHILEYRDIMQREWAPSRVNGAIKILRRLLNFSIDRGYGLTHNPGLKIKNLKTGDGDGFGPWKEEAIDVALDGLVGISRTVFYLAYFTGQRSSDILKMKWADIAGKEIHVVQDKTGAELWVPLHPDLQAELAITERRGETIVAAELIRADGHPSNTAGQPISGRALHHYWGEERNRLGLRGNRFENTLHGLRKNATINLLEAGCTNSEAKAITGHRTDVMVNLYSEKVNQRRQAREAMDKVVQMKRATEAGD